MIRKIIRIDEEKCNGCGACANACHEGAIRMENGKAKLIRDDYCDGLGSCLPVCPTGAISFEEREAAAYDEAAVKARQQAMHQCEAGGCPSQKAGELRRAPANPAPASPCAVQSELSQWPVQIKLAPENAPFFNGRHLLIAADCTAYARADFHRQFMHNKITLIGCPKLDEGDYTEKLTAILKENEVKSVTVVRMEVPCCGSIESAVKAAIQASGRFLPWQVVTLSLSGKILD